MGIIPKIVMSKSINRIGIAKVILKPSRYVETHSKVQMSYA